VGTLGRALAVVLVLSPIASADPDDGGAALPPVQIHGFASEGGFVSTDNDYIGASSRGTLEFFEAAINFQSDVTDKLHVGFQLYGRDVGVYQDLPPRLDWAYLDYRFRDWLGLRAGIIKMPYGLYNEYADIDASRLEILLPQAVYPLADRSALLAQTGFALYGHRPLGCAGELDYQAWLGTLDIPANALEVSGATLDSSDAKYVTGAQLFWHPPVDGLKIGVTYLRTSIDFQLMLDAANVQALIMAGLEPPTYDGSVTISQRPDSVYIGSAEYTRGDWLFAAEYARWETHQESNLPPAVLPPFDRDSERFYAMAQRRLTPWLAVGGYYAAYTIDVDDREGRNRTMFPRPYDAYQRDGAASVRFDVNDHWLWKVEAHLFDGAADLDPTRNASPTQWWGLFLFKTTVVF